MNTQTSKLINGKNIATHLKNQLKQEIQQLITHYHTQPCIATIKVGHDPSSELYLKLRDQACIEVGIKSIHNNFEKNITQPQLIQKINQLNI